MILQLKNVSLIKNKKFILKDLNWEVKKGEHWVILGANGSGKTMLLKMLTGYIWPSRGEITLLGEKFGETDIGKLRQLVGWVSFDLQSRMQEEFKVLDIVLSGYFGSIGLYKKPGKELFKIAGQALAEVGLKGLGQRSFTTLSYGEQKRVLIGRSLINQPRLLMLDEPCSGLDLRARATFLELIEELAKKNSPTIIFVTHHLEEIVPDISHILALKKGRIMGKGIKKDILTKDLTTKLYE